MWRLGENTPTCLLQLGITTCFNSTMSIGALIQLSLLLQTSWSPWAPQCQDVGLKILNCFCVLLAKIVNLDRTAVPSFLSRNKCISLTRFVLYTSSLQLLHCLPLLSKHVISPMVLWTHPSLVRPQPWFRWLTKLEISPHSFIYLGGKPCFGIKWKLWRAFGLPLYIAINMLSNYTPELTTITINHFISKQVVVY
jgi:hypothetical protein